MMRSAALAPIPLLGIAVLFSACLTPKRNYPTIRHYTITATPPSPQSGPDRRDAILLRPFTTSPLHHETTFLLRRSPNEIERDYYNRFAAPPAELIREQVAGWLTQQGTFTDVRLSSVATEGLTMTGHLALIEADVTTRPPVARMELTLRITQRDGTLLALHHGRSAIVASGPTPDEIAAAWGSALTEILNAVNWPE